MIPRTHDIQDAITMTIFDRAAADDCDLASMGRQFAQLSAGEAETLIDAHVVQAISEWRVADATFWHRVKLRSRMIRATASCQPRLARA